MTGKAGDGAENRQEARGRLCPVLAAAGCGGGRLSAWLRTDRKSVCNQLLAAAWLPLEMTGHWLLGGILSEAQKHSWFLRTCNLHRCTGHLLKRLSQSSMF